MYLYILFSLKYKQNLPSSRLDEGSHSHKYTTPEEFYRIQCFEALDLLLVELEDRFEQKEYINPVLALEELLLRAANFLTKLRK